MRFGGRGRMLEWLRTGAWVLEDIRHDDGAELVLRADHVALQRSPGLDDRWMTALELPLFAWERALGGTSSWSVPLSAQIAETDEAGSRLVLRSRASDSRLLLNVTAGRLAVSGGGRITWTSDGPGRLVVLAAADDADLDRTNDLLGRKGLTGLGRQRAQHAEQLHRGGVAMRAAGLAGLDDAVEWAKVRADALLGARLAGDLDELAGAAAEIRLAEGLLAAGLTHLPRTFYRRGTGEDLRGWRAFEQQFVAWTREPDESAEAGLPATDVSSPPAEAALDRARAPAAAEIAGGRVDAESVASLLIGSLGSLWGVGPDAPHGRVMLAPDLVTLGGAAALSRLRVGRSVLDVRVRRRGEVVSLAVRKGAGPPIAVDCTIRGATVRDVLIDGHPVGGMRARFEARASHDVQLHLRAEPPLSSSAS